MPSLSYNNDYLFWSQTEAVSVTLAAAATTVSIGTAQRGEVSRRLASSLGIDLIGNEAVFSIPMALLDPSDVGREITANSDYVTATEPGGQSARWNVLSAVLKADGSFWECVCRKAK